MDVDDACARLLAGTHRFLLEFAAPVLGAELLRWSSTPALNPPTPSSLPVLRWLPEATTAASRASAPLVRALTTAAPHLAWRQTYSPSEMPVEFLENYGWTEIVGAGGLIRDTTLACGFLLLGPRTLYPSHAHAAEELYWPLSGTASWRQSRSGWQRKAPGEVIRHGALEPHAMRTEKEALLALYLWHGTGLDAPARLTGAGAADS